MGPSLTELVQSGSINPAIDGDAIPKKLGDTKPYVGARCTGTGTLKYACLSCAVMLANPYNVAEHVAAGVHVIACWCADHGAEAFVPFTVRERLAEVEAQLQGPALVASLAPENPKANWYHDHAPPAGADGDAGTARGDVGAAPDALSAPPSGGVPAS